MKRCGCGHWRRVPRSTVWANLELGSVITTPYGSDGIQVKSFALAALQGNMIRERLARIDFMPERISDDITVIECATFLGAPIRFDNWLRERSEPQPRIGEHGGEMLRESGCDGDDITALRNEMITHAVS